MSSKNNASVSCVMVSRGNRIPFLDITLPNFFGQTYENVLEWVIVNGSQSQEEADSLDAYLAGLKESHPKLQTFPWAGRKNIGAYRNQVNAVARGEIIVSFDDDDYYFVGRVKSTVERMVKKGAAIAGTESQYIYDFDLDRMFVTNLPLKSTATNNTMAYTRAFAQAHKYDETVGHAEESSFLAKTPVFQIPKEECGIQISHVSNTYNKHFILLQGICEAEGVIPKDMGSCFLIRRGIKDIVSKKDHGIVDAMRALLPDCDAVPPDFVFYCGRSNVEWDPASKSLGGSEQAVVEVASKLAAQGFRVECYGYITAEKEYQGASYKHFYNFKFRQQYRVLVLWRLFGAIALGMDLKADKIVLDLHDNYSPSHAIMINHIDRIDKVWFKSNYHRQLIEQGSKHKFADDKVFIQPNGIRVEEFMKDHKVVRDPFRMIYASSYDRGLAWILQGFWQLIHRLEPRAELHVYYGMGANFPQDLRQVIEKGLQAEGVMDHGRQSVDIIAREKQKSKFHLYPCFSDAEIDCISVRESLVCGCVPLLADHGVFKEREGVYLEGLVPGDQKTYLKSALKIVQMMRQHESHPMDKILEGMRQSLTITSWEDSAMRLLAECGVTKSKKFTVDTVTLNV
jgi:glycosyltransferase involved in cell wall biosynthesis